MVRNIDANKTAAVNVLTHGMVGGGVVNGAVAVR